MDKINVSVYIEDGSDLPQILATCQENGYNSIITPIVNNLYEREFLKEDIMATQIRFTRSALILPAETWQSKIIAHISSKDVDSKIETVRKMGEKRLIQELNLANHLTTANGFILLKINSLNTENLAKIIIDAYYKGNVLIEVDMVNMKKVSSLWRKDDEKVSKVASEDPWNYWNKLRLNMNFKCRVKLALVVSSDIPTDEEIFRWIGEPVEMLVIPNSVFISNQNNYPVLSKGHQRMITLFLQNTKCNIAVKPTSQSDHRIKLYAEYLRHITKLSYENDPMLGYDDYLEIPLQPLYDNLDTFTYEIFERDPVKYILYQNAIQAAIIDKVAKDDINTATIRLLIVGAGRGPLVRAALNASYNSGIKMKIYVVEKNPNAIVTLYALIDELWPDKDITLISTDMRTMVLDEKVDIIVSELLGSFGDNELSPECLDGAQKHLKEDGISIPCRSISYVNPTMSSKIYNGIRVMSNNINADCQDAMFQNPTEVNYVIYLKNVYQIDQPKQLFEFVHPNKDEVVDNTRMQTLKFEAKLDCVLHGFSAYFSAQLYKDIEISILPETHTAGMTSWFPMFFPVPEPQQVKKGDLIEVTFWRNVTSHKVWYEWKTNSPKVSRISNFNGKSHPILL